jgi:hypothetical protein
MGKWAAVALATPACVLAVGLALALMLGVVGRNPMWPRYDLNLSEAAGVRDQAEVVRLIGLGEDPNGRRDIRPGLLFHVSVRLTPLEAAVASQRAEMVERLLANGALMDAVVWNRLRCLSRGREVPLVLERHRPPGGVMRCEGVIRPW